MNKDYAFVGGWDAYDEGWEREGSEEGKRERSERSEREGIDYKENRDGRRKEGRVKNKKGK